MKVMGGTHRPQQEVAGAQAAISYYIKRPRLDAAGVIKSALLLRWHWSKNKKASDAFIDGFVDMATIVAQGRGARS